MLTGKVIGLRAIEREDLAQLLVWRNRPEFRRYFREIRELGKESQNSWYEKVVIKDHKTHMFAITELEKSELLGACGLCYIDWINRNADFSIYIGANNLYIDDVFAVDAARILIKYGFEELGLHRVWAEIYNFDENKKRFFDTLGFKLDGIHRETHWAEGIWHDSLFYSLLAKDLS